MKHFISFLAIVTVVCILFLVWSCGSSEDPQPDASQLEEVKQVLTSTTWKIQGVMVDGVDQTALFKDLTLNFTETGFTTTHGGVVWPASGTWSFTDQTGKEIMRSDGLALTVEEVSTTKLILRLTWSRTTLGGGRVSSVSGDHSFEFRK